MDTERKFIEAAVVAFRERLGEALAEMRRADTPASFKEAERALHELARELASELTQHVVQEMCDDELRGERATERVRERAARKGVVLRSERKRETEIRTLGGQTIRVTTRILKAALPRAPFPHLGPYP